MSFGFGVGDLLAVSKLARSTWKKFQDSADQFKALRTEAANLCLVLDDAAQTVPGRELGEKDARTLSSLVQACRDILADMNSMLQKYENLGTSSSSALARTQKAWRKIRWDPDEVNELRSRVISNTVSLDAFNSSIASKTFQAVKDNLTELTQRQDQRELQAIINWLSPLQFPAQQSDTISRRQEGTGQWLLQSHEFNTWLNTGQKTLFCSGIPGAGKTMLAAIVIDHLCNTMRSVDIAVVYIYCNYKMQLDQTPVNLVASLLKQLLQQQGVISGDLKSLYCRHLKNETRPTLNEVFEVLQSEINKYPRVFVVVDALDECPVENRVRPELLSKLYALQTSHTVNLMMISRHIPDIMQEFQHSLQLEIRASEEDVRRYLDGQMFRLASCVKRNNDLQEAIKDSIVRAVDGMFLLAQLHLDSLADKTSPKAIKNALRTLPQGSDALDRAYDQAMKRIDDQEPGFRQLANQVLAWITHAERPLTIVEFQHALAIEEGEPELDRENITDIEELVSVCVGLVAVDQETNIVRLVHYTTQEYCRRIRMQRFPNARKTIAVACLTYLSFDVFAEECSVTYHQRDDFESRLQQNPFLEYAALYWSSHACGDMEREVEGPMMTFLMDQRKVLNSCQVLILCPKKSNFRYHDISKANRISAVQLSALFGLRDTMSLLLKNGMEADSRDYYGRSPLSWASQFGYDAIVELLLSRGAEVDSKHNKGRTPLSYAAQEGHKAVVALMLAQGAAIDSKDGNDQTPLSVAAQRGQEAVVEFLMAHGASVHSKNHKGRTPLSYAAQGGYRAVVELLLTQGAAVDARDINDQTPLSVAAQRGHEAVVEALLNRGAAVDSKCSRERTPLSYAAQGGHAAAVELLLTRGASADSESASDQTPLSYAAQQGHEPVVKLLLTRGAAADSKDNNDQTPLSYAAQFGHEAVVNMLLMREVEIDSKDYRKQTPLSYAAQRGHEAVVQLLLTREVDIDSKDYQRQTPLSYAAQEGHEAVVKLLLMREIEINSKDYQKKTPLSYAVQFGHETVVELLLTRGSAVDSRDEEDQTPLSHAARFGHQNVAELLLTRGAAVDSKDNSDQTPLFSAARFGHKAVVELLLTGGAAVDSRDDENETPLFYAARFGHEAVAELLLARGAAVDSKDNSDQTPLSYAARFGHRPVVEVLLAREVEIDSKDYKKKTPLSYAAIFGHEAVVELLLAHGALVDSKSHRGRTPLLYAAKWGHEAVVKLLMARGAATDAPDEFGQTPLSYASSSGHETVVKLLQLPVRKRASSFVSYSVSKG